ncbi:hypothetical protein QQX09_12205 [Demequina sp. SYSU T00192]|uniref:Uncharacterized protein n=1 Tax=Demequina litoralis TaxID=3051660 RepID=A0ABT8GBV4_9MICO|nr:hypothetical protein [Demequina sp. SYSU T00192]MDN4476620.1 hypothetical protein [Demequina sp. SYSU T00192]
MTDPKPFTARPSGPLDPDDAARVALAGASLPSNRPRLADSIVPAVNRKDRA